MVAVGADKGQHDRVGQSTKPFVDVANGVGRAGKDHTVHIQGVVVLVVNVCPSIGQHLHIADVRALAQVGVRGQLVKDFLGVLAGALLRLTGGDGAVCLAALRPK